jgi:hypothetical protein
MPDAIKNPVIDPKEIGPTNAAAQPPNSVMQQNKQCQRAVQNIFAAVLGTSLRKFGC